MTITADRHNGPCVVCMTPTDTALGFIGEEDWCVAGLAVLGLPTDVAIATYQLERPDRPDASGRYTVYYRVCVECVRKCPGKFPDPGITINGVSLPGIMQP